MRAKVFLSGALVFALFGFIGAAEWSDPPVLHESTPEQHAQADEPGKGDIPSRFD